MFGSQFSVDEIWDIFSNSRIASLSTFTRHLLIPFFLHISIHFPDKNISTMFGCQFLVDENLGLSHNEPATFLHFRYLLAKPLLIPFFMHFHLFFWEQMWVKCLRVSFQWMGIWDFPTTSRIAPLSTFTTKICGQLCHKMWGLPLLKCKMCF